MNDREKAITPYTHVAREQKTARKVRNLLLKSKEFEGAQWKPFSPVVLERSYIERSVLSRLQHENRCAQEAAYRALNSETSAMAAYWRTKFSRHNFFADKYRGVLDQTRFKYPKEMNDELTRIDNLTTGPSDPELVAEMDEFVRTQGLRMARLDLDDVTNAARHLCYPGEDVTSEQIVSWRKLHLKEREILRKKQSQHDPLRRGYSRNETSARTVVVSNPGKHVADFAKEPQFHPITINAEVRGSSGLQFSKAIREAMKDAVFACDYATKPGGDDTVIAKGHRDGDTFVVDEIIREKK